jgi:uncharacterized protein YceH (UPF0502 family)
MSLGLSPVELRVLGSLIEKERATPQGYPLTGNSLRLACNQSSNRHPVVDYDDRLIEATVSGLKEQGLLRYVYSPSNRATKYRHILDDALDLSVPELAVLGVLFLRGPQTVGEIKGRTERLHPFADLAEVEAVLDALAGRQPDALALRLARQPGQKDSRYVHLLGDVEPDAQVVEPSSRAIESPMASPSTTLSTTPATAPADPRVDGLERIADQLRIDLDELRADLEQLHRQLGD